MDQSQGMETNQNDPEQHRDVGSDDEYDSDDSEYDGSSDEYDSDEVEIIENLMEQMKTEMKANQELKEEMMGYMEQLEKFQNLQSAQPSPAVGGGPASSGDRKPAATADNSQHELVASLIIKRQSKEGGPDATLK